MRNQVPNRAKGTAKNVSGSTHVKSYCAGPFYARSVLYWILGFLCDDTYNDDTYVPRPSVFAEQDDNCSDRRLFSM